MSGPRLSITHVLECLADPEKLRVVAMFDHEVGELIPYLNATLPNGVYNPGMNALTWREGHRLLTIHPDRATLAKVNDEADAWRVADSIEAMLADVLARRETLVPNFARRERLGILDVFKLLPGTNCGRCGVPTCMALAAQIAAESAVVAACPVLSEPGQELRKEILVGLLQAGGYETGFAR